MKNKQLKFFLFQEWWIFFFFFQINFNFFFNIEPYFYKNFYFVAYAFQRERNVLDYNLIEYLLYINMAINKHF